MSIFEKAKALGAEVVDSVKDVAEDGFDKVKDMATKEEGFLVESFDSPEDLEARLNELLKAMKEVDCQSVTEASDVDSETMVATTFLVAVIKVS